ncbi:hypothetical protein F6X40_07435 [Paraburkholderia sp. UCT31]|uniref:hypothetical protein n=1 Tax=Paraburkholderia sp. UCT31 TaxID=2615209 RepID=UPI0016563423|nr:hypothetical protein [Paraburkholderia sp. UCT31]MBC8736644.1 hypothetical protein [Paraburkholderia sp. UCT31]
MSDDQKEDRVLEVEGKKIGVLPALRQELMTETGQDFQIYTVPRFLSHVKKTESPELGEESIEEAATVRDQPEQVKKLDTLQLLRRELEDHLALLALDKESEHK